MTATAPMTLKASNANGDNCPKGNYAGTIANVEFVEPNENSLYGNDPQVKLTVKIRKVIFATPDPPSEENPKPSSPQSWVGKDFWAFATPSLNKRAKLRAWVESIVERPLGDDEEFDLNQLIGTQVVMTIGRTNTGRHKATDFSRDHENDTATAAAETAPAGNEPTARQLKTLAAFSVSDTVLDAHAVELFDCGVQDLTRRQMAKLIESLNTDDEGDEPDF